MFIVKVRKGNTRIAVIFLNLLVVKFPNPRLDGITKPSKKDFVGLRTGASYFLRFFRNIYWALLYGSAVNISEAIIYLHARPAQFLTPVFTIGVCSFQKYQGEEKPSREEILDFEKGLSEKARVCLDECDIHQWLEDNWRRTSQGLRLIDYGEGPLRNSWSRFILGNKREIAAATARK